MTAERRMRRPTTPSAMASRATARPTAARLPADPAEEPRNGGNEPLFPSLRRRPAEERADEIVEALKDAILNPGRLDGSTGMAYSDWSKEARKRIIRAVREAEASASMRELMSAHRIGGMCLRVGFMLLASLMSFTAFWYGIVHIWRAYGPAWGLGATLSALGLSFAFVVSGLLMSSSDIEEMRSKIRDRFGADD
ncbi:MAG: hypothetical protein RLO51_06870 [Thalassobaculum sp.]|uniref:hypothetical protein n=1 Tax=Thalassobaculum sp. TaxID=2022740 RepID=UPI0032F09C59